MKIRRLEIRGLRGVPQELLIDLGQRSLVLLGENGTGKSTIVDAFELWSTGDLTAYHREGYQLDAAVNVGAAMAEVVIIPDGVPPMRQTIRNGRASGLEPVRREPTDISIPGPIPLLRHRTMVDFMSRSPAEKKDALLRLFGLDALLEFRSALRTAVNAIERRQQDATNRVIDHDRALRSLAGSADVVAVATQLVETAGIDGRVASEADLNALPLDAVPDAASDPAPTVERLATAASSLAGSPAGSWNEYVQNRAAQRDAALAALINAGRRTLEGRRWTDCPLCEQPIDHDDVLERLVARSSELAEVEQRVADLRQRATAYLGGLRTLRSVAAEAANRLDGEWSADLGGLRDACDRAAAAWEAALGATAAVEEAPLPVVDLEALRNHVAGGSAARAAAQALARLAALQQQSRRLAASRNEQTTVTARLTHATAFQRLAEQHVEATIRDLLRDLSQRAARYYAELVRLPYYRDLRLDYRSARGGGIEFGLTFADRHQITPPQRIMSESQLNALGLALFLAQVKEGGTEWRVLVLDDIVNSFDADHRRGLVDLLHREFADWQVIICTHDPLFAHLMSTQRGYRSLRILSWSPATGPILGEGDLRVRLRERLDQGLTADELGGLARKALEDALAEPASRLSLAVRYDRESRLFALDFVTALERGLPETDLPAVVGRMRAASYMANLGAHERPTAAPVTRDELYRLVDDLDELYGAFRCSGCSRPVWDFESRDRRSFQCRCSQLSLRLRSA